MHLRTLNLWSRSALPAGLILIVALGLVLYVPSLRFGFIWDDPQWFGRLVGRGMLELVAPQPTYQFYRPATMLMNGAFMRADGTFDPFWLHAWQLLLHSANIVLAYALARALGVSRGGALATALLFAVYPLSHQAVAWAGPPQPAVTTCLLCAGYLYARWRERRRPLAFAGMLALFLLALGIQESAAPLAGVFLLLEWHLARRGAARRYSFAPAAPLTLTAGYLVLWTMAPKVAGFSRPTFSLDVAEYLVQGLAYPLLGRPGGWGESANGPGWLLAAALVVTAWLAIVFVRSGRSSLALLGVAWYAAGLLPAWAGLTSQYVFLASRLFYPGAFGVALLWGGLLDAAPVFGRQRRLWAGLAWILVAVIVVQSVWIVADFNRLFALGTRQIDALIDWSVARPQSSGLFVNFPDRYTPRRPPYPVGYWGITLAPISVNLSEYARITHGVEPQTDSLSVPALDGGNREASPYLFDMRGVIAGTDVLYRTASEVDEVLLTRYRSDGAMRLLQVGHIVPAQGPAGSLARFGATLALEDAALETGDEEWHVALTWRCLAPARPEDTIFVHLGLPGQPPVAQADGDLLGGLLPLTTCQAGDAIIDRRVLTLPPGPLPAGALVRVGVYNREAGKRLPAVDQAAAPLADNAWVVR